MNIIARFLVVVALALMGTFSACTCTGGQGPCTSDAECDATGQKFSKCDEKQGICICTDSRACGPNEFCNGVGRCQTESGCSTNDDCGTGGVADPNLFCDVTTSECLSVGDCNPAQGQLCCTLDDQCPFRQICDAVTQGCVPGCRDDADCLLLEGCSGASFGQLGQCGTACTADNQCPFGDLCNLSVGTCEPDRRGPYCLACTGGVASTDCGTPGNYCLIDETQVNASFCGVDCAQGEATQACPNGYNCQQVIIVPQSTPQCNGPESCVIPNGATQGNCSRNSTSVCAKDEDCPEGPPGGDCGVQVGHYGSCLSNTSIGCRNDSDCPEGTCDLIECRGSEAGILGFCTCTRDSDCPSDSCKDADSSDPHHPIAGHCVLSGHQCFEDIECDIITCVEGGCLIGSNCAPSNDRSCADLQTVTTP